MKPALVIALLVLPVLAACASPRQTAATPTEQWNSRVLVEPRPEQVKLVVHDGGLSQNQAHALATFVEHWRDAGAGEIVIEAPREGPAGAHGMMVDARDFLAAQGVPADRFRLVGYEAGGAMDAPLIVGFLRHEVVLPRCGRSWENLTRTANNTVHSNFGCAVTANMAAQIANPEDLLQPRPMTPADAQRRDTVFGAYRAGQVTSSAANPQADVSISSAVN